MFSHVVGAIFKSANGVPEANVHDNRLCGLSLPMRKSFDLVTFRINSITFRLGLTWAGHERNFSLTPTVDELIIVVHFLFL